MTDTDAETVLEDFASALAGQLLAEPTAELKAAARERDAEVAVDITPGRKFMSAIAFAAGMRYDADHVYYFYVSGEEHMGAFYPEIPRTATTLYDLTEAV